MSAPRRPGRRGPARRTRGLLWDAGLGPDGWIRSRGCRGQASVLLVGGLAGVLIGALVLGMVARGLAHEGAAQRAADLSALAGARAMREAYPRLFEPARVDGRPNPLHLDRAKYLELGRAAARATADRKSVV